MAHGQGVTVIPQNALLTTQEAAGLLGISRPTLVRLLEDGEMPYEQRGRHRRIMLSDLLTYQQKMRQQRRESLNTTSNQWPSYSRRPKRRPSVWYMATVSSLWMAFSSRSYADRPGSIFLSTSTG